MNIRIPSRRKFTKLLCGAAIGSLSHKGAAQEKVLTESLDDLLAMSVLIEEQAGDPLDEGGIIERLTLVNPGRQKAITDRGNIGPKKLEKDLALRMVTLTEKFADEGVSRSTYPGQVTEFLNLLDFELKYAQGGYVRYCAAGVSYAACRAYCDISVKEPYAESVSNENRLKLFKSKLSTIREYYFFPSAAVRIIKADAEKRKTWVPRESTPKRGWLVIFSWNGQPLGNHIGIVDRAEKDYLHTLEYNTSISGSGSQSDGGAVARKVRKRNQTILGYVKLYD